MCKEAVMSWIDKATGKRLQLVIARMESLTREAIEIEAARERREIRRRNETDRK